MTNEKIPPEALKGCNNLVKVCSDLTGADNVLIIADSSTEKIGQMIYDEALKITGKINIQIIKPLTIHGEEPSRELAVLMLNSDVIFGLTKMSLAHTRARQNATEAGAKYLSLPQYSLEVLSSPALLADFKAFKSASDKISRVFSDGNELKITSDAGTCLTCSIKNRTGNSAPGWCYARGTIASPPDAEANIAPVEKSANGIIIVDGSIPAPGLGMLSEPVKLTVKNGLIEKAEGKKADILMALFENTGKINSKMLAEVGVGLNEKACIRGHMLEDEGCAGTAHFGFGSNVTIGGTNDVPIHIDHVIRQATITVDEKVLVKNGVII